MLERLYIRNYVIIEELTLEFDRHLNVLTGETGAGKSIIAGALSLILGERADTSVLINQEEKCIVEAVFQIHENQKVREWLQKEDLDAGEEELLVRREINSKGKSRAFINDSPVLLTQLNQCSGLLVDLHRQFDQYLMREGAFVYEVLDAVSKNQDNISNYQHAFRDFKAIDKRYREAVAEKSDWQKEADYKQFLLDELTEAGFQPDELEKTEEEFQKLSHAEQIKQTLQSLYFNIKEAEPSLNSKLHDLLQQLETISAVYLPAQDLLKRLESARLEIADIADECQTLNENLDLDAAQIQLFQERLDLGNKLLKKHQVQTTEELFQIQQTLTEELQRHQSADEEILQLEKERKQLEKAVKTRAWEIHQVRIARAPSFSGEINRTLRLIGMPNAAISVKIELLENYTEKGKDLITFLLDANRSGQFQPMQKSASGGELSRIMLCIKSLTAEAIDLPTLIFDEVDTGISGEAAKQVGILLQQLSNRHQVICITHQPQVAGRGDKHFFVYKANDGESIKTGVKTLNSKERILALAKMVGGENPSDAALENAKELLVMR